MPAMRWSKVRTRMRALIAPSVVDRVGIHSTRYRSAHDGDGRAWMTLDGVEIVSMSTIVAWSMHSRGATSDELQANSVFWQGELGAAMFDYPNLSLAQVLSSDRVLIRALGMLDRRLGKARLRGLVASRDQEHPLVQELLAFRARAEGVVGSGRLSGS